MIIAVSAAIVRIAIFGAVLMTSALLSLMLKPPRRIARSNAVLEQ